jgi:hypothetical protein
MLHSQHSHVDDPLDLPIPDTYVAFGIFLWIQVLSYVLCRCLLTFPLFAEETARRRREAEEAARCEKEEARKAEEAGARTKAEAQAKKDMAKTHTKMARLIVPYEAGAALVAAIDKSIPVLEAQKLALEMRKMHHRPPHAKLEARICGLREQREAAVRRSARDRAKRRTAWSS